MVRFCVLQHSVWDPSSKDTWKFFKALYSLLYLSKCNVGLLHQTLPWLLALLQTATESLAEEAQEYEILTTPHVISMQDKFCITACSSLKRERVEFLQGFCLVRHFKPSLGIPAGQNWEHTVSLIMRVVHAHFFAWTLNRDASSKLLYFSLIRFHGTFCHFSDWLSYYWAFWVNLILTLG